MPVSTRENLAKKVEVSTVNYATSIAFIELRKYAKNYHAIKKMCPDGNGLKDALMQYCEMRNSEFSDALRSDYERSVPAIKYHIDLIDFDYIVSKW